MLGAELYERIDAEDHGSRIDTIAKIGVDYSWDKSPCPRYLDALKVALLTHPPVYGRAEYLDLYREVTEDAEWMSISLISNAEREGDGATRLWSLAACSDGKEYDLIKRHAVDESRHALAYLTILDLTFPGAISPDFRRDLRRLSPSYSMAQEVVPVPGSPYARTPSVDDYIQMNIAEIRTTLHHMMQRKALLYHSPSENQASILKVSDRLLIDEIRHVGYCGHLIEEKAQLMNLKDLTNLFCRRMNDFNRITREEIGQSHLVFD